MMNDTFAIETVELTKTYGSGNTEVVAMSDATMEVRHGEVVALLGPSGSGKSTFLTAVGLINPPTAGRIFINGSLVMDGPRALTNLRTFRRSHIGYIFQKSNLIPFLSARENVQIALELSGWPSRRARRRVMALLDELGVADRADNLPSMLSGGQQQRVAVARALANEPSIKSCYDCHSHETVWPWYSRIAPVSWLVAKDVHEGRDEMNFWDLSLNDKSSEQFVCVNRRVIPRVSSKLSTGI